jgi:uncharacterized membrane protein
MHDPDTAPASPPDERLYVLFGYALFLVAVANGLTGLLGVILAYVRRGEAVPLWASHYRNMIVMFWAVLLSWVLVAALFLHGLMSAFLFMAWPAWHPWALMELPMFAAAVPLLVLGGVLFTVWYFYRGIRGLIRALDGKPY